MGGKHLVTSQEKRDSKVQDQAEDLADETVDFFREMSKLLKSRRLESQEGPFRGFKSPPGRF